MRDERTVPPELLGQLTLAILDHSAEEGLQAIKLIRSYLDTWETFLEDRQQLRDHLKTTHQAGPTCMEAGTADLNRRHWEAHGSDLATFLDAHPVQM